MRQTIQALRSDLAEQTKSERVADKAEVLEFLTKIFRTPVGSVDASSPLCQEASVDRIGEQVVRVKIKMPDKIRAIERLARMLGWDEPEQIKCEAGDTLASLIASIRRREDQTQKKS